MTGAVPYFCVTVFLVLGILLRRWHRAFPAAQLPPPAALPDEVLLDRLWQIVRREQVPVLPRSFSMWNNNPRSPSHGRDAAGLYDPTTKTIMLRPDYYRNPWVLAHELGHHNLVEEGRLEHSEAEADARGRELLLSVLSPQEAATTMTRIDKHLPALPRPDQTS